MLEILALMIAAISIGISFGSSVRLRRVELRLQAAEDQLRNSLAKQLAERADPKVHPLEGLRISLQIDQDHPHPVFATLLKEQLFAAGVELVVEDPDLVLRGRLVCNGYSEVYYEADFSLGSGEELLFTLAQKPPHGDRQENLAIEIVTRLKEEWRKQAERHERRAAIRELRFD